MTDVFFSYSSVDRERVRSVRDALAAHGFEVFWDLQVPAGEDWDSWIRRHLTKCKCAVVFWSAASAISDNVRHEATVAKQQGKLVSVLLEPLTAEQFPLGHYAQQAANLSNWNADEGHDEWRKFRRQFEAKLTPSWVRRQLDELEAELVGERARREDTERRDRTLQAQITKEVQTQQDLKQERDKALDETAGLKATVEELTRARSEVEAKQAETQQGLKRQLEKALDETATLKATVQELTQARSNAEERQAAAQRRDAALQAQIAKEAEVQQNLKLERDVALDEAVATKATNEKLTQARLAAEAQHAEAQQALSRERDTVLTEVAALKITLKELTQQQEHTEARAVELSHERERAQAEIVATKEQLADAKDERERAQAEVAALKEQLANASHEHDQALKEIAAERQRVENFIHERVASALKEAVLPENLLPTRELEIGLQQLAALKSRFANEPNAQADDELAGLTGLLTRLAKRAAESKNSKPFKSEESKRNRIIDHGVLAIAIGFGLVISLMIFFGVK